MDSKSDIVICVPSLIEVFRINGCHQYNILNIPQSGMGMNVNHVASLKKLEYVVSIESFCRNSTDSNVCASSLEVAL